MALIILNSKLGASYITDQFTKDIDSNFGKCYVFGENTYQTTFTNADLVANVLTVTHNLGTQFTTQVIIRPDNTEESTIPIKKITDTNTVTFNFGGSIDSGTWSIAVIKIA